MFVLKADRFAAIVAEVRANGIKGAAVVTEHFGRIERIDLYLGTTVLTICAQMLEALEVTALALPITYLILDILERSSLAKIRNRKDRGKDRLQTHIVPLFRNKVHLQKAVVGFALHFDQVRDLS
jgi:hypothetical protein